MNILEETGRGDKERRQGGREGKGKEGGREREREKERKQSTERGEDRGKAQVQISDKSAKDPRPKRNKSPLPFAVPPPPLSLSNHHINRETTSLVIKIYSSMKIIEPEELYS